jgi:hypothetical protein
MYPRQLWLLALLILASCGMPFNESQIKDTPEAKFFEKMIERLAAHDTAAVKAATDPAMPGYAGIETDIATVGAMFPSQNPKSIQYLGWWTKYSNTGRSAEVSAEYAFEGRTWLLATMSLSGEPGTYKISGLRVDALPAPYAELNAFSLNYKTPLHYAFLFVWGAVALLVIYAFAICLQTRGMKYKWLWAIFILVGVFAVTLNWTTGELGVAPISINIPVVNLGRIGSSGPWIATILFPLGAVLFLMKRRAMTRLLGEVHASPAND